METVWNNLRRKPQPYEYVLVETYTKHYPYRICVMSEDGVWRDAYKTSYFFPKSCGKKSYRGNDANVFDKIKKLKRVGIYSKVSAILYANKENAKSS